MKWIKRIFGHLWAIWALIWFIALAIPLFPLTYLSIRFAPAKKRFDVGMWYSRYWSKLLLLGMGMPVRSYGKEIVKSNAPCIIASNHVSQLDILVSAAAIPINFKFLSKKEVQKVPVVGYLVTVLHILVDRQNPESRKASMEEMIRQVDAGHSVNIYLEGTRNKGPRLLKDFYDGAFRLAVATQRPIVVQTISNTWNRENKNRPFRLFPGIIRVYFDGPVPTRGLNEGDIPMLKEQVREMMLKRLEAVHGKEYSL